MHQDLYIEHRMFFVPTIDHTPFPRFDQVEGLTMQVVKCPAEVPQAAGDFPSLTGNWRLLSHRSIPYASQVEARVALRCDHRGCIAFGKQLDAMRWRWNDTNVNQCYIKGAKTRPEAETWTSIKFELFSLCPLHDLSMWNFSFCFVVLHEYGRIVRGDALFSKSPHRLFSRHPCPWLWASPHQGVGSWRWLWDGCDGLPRYHGAMGDGDPAGETAGEKNGEWLLMLGRTVLQSAKNSKESKLEHVGTSK